MPEGQEQLDPFLTRVRRALAKGPRHVLARVGDNARLRSRGPWSRVFPKLLTEPAFLRAVHAGSIDEFWDRQQRAPFFLSVANRDAYVRAFDARFPGVRKTVIAAADRVVPGPGHGGIARLVGELLD